MREFDLTNRFVRVGATPVVRFLAESSLAQLLLQLIVLNKLVVNLQIGWYVVYGRAVVSFRILLILILRLLLLLSSLVQICNSFAQLIKLGKFCRLGHFIWPQTIRPLIVHVHKVLSKRDHFLRLYI